MNSRIFKNSRIAVAGIIVLALAFGLVALGAGNGGQGGGQQRVVSALGIAQVQGQDVLVEVLVLVLPGGDAGVASRAALESQGARPIQPHELGTDPVSGDPVGFTLTRLVWDQFFDNSTNNDFVTQNYNPNNEPANINGQDDLLATQGTWGAPTSSRATISNGGITIRCPSLVKECPGPQVFDTFNDVGWLDLGRPKRGFVTLGVTWSGTSNLTGPEADMALTTNRAVSWVDSLNPGSGEVDVETVFLHENGHVLSLGHSADSTSVMFTPLSGVDRTLGTDDVEGITFLYDSSIGGSVTGIVSDSDGSPIGGATVALEGTDLEATTADNGKYTISGVPDPVTYTVVASADDFDSGKTRLTVSGGATGVDFSLAGADGGGGGGGACPPAKAAKGKC